MTNRTTEKTVTFKRPFSLGRFDEKLPAGDYLVETEEELLEGLSFPVYRRKLTLIHLPVNPRRPGTRQALPINPDALAAALLRDQAVSDYPQATDASPGFEKRG